MNRRGFIEIEGSMKSLNLSNYNFHPNLIKRATLTFLLKRLSIVKIN